ncbi:MAG: murein hydrolase activator EnvC family protein [Acidobacteriota bacterium]
MSIAGMLALVVFVAPAPLDGFTGHPAAQRSAQEQGGGESAVTRAQRDPEATGHELESLRRQIAGLESQLNGLRQQRASIVGDFERADIELALGRRQLQLLQLRLGVLSGETVRRTEEVERLDSSLAEARSKLSTRVVALYRMGPLSYSRFLFSADSAEEALAGYQVMVRLAAEDRKLVASVRDRRDELQRAMAAMRSTRERLARLQAEETVKIPALERQQTERESLLRRIDVEAEAGRQALASQRQSARALEDLLVKLSVAPPSPAPESGGQAPDEAAPEAAATPTPTAGKADDVGAKTSASAAIAPTFEGARGTMNWPGDGPVTLSFGRHRHPVYDTYTVSKGIEIGAEAGSPVASVYKGRVAFADWFKGYGLVVILSHGNEFFTLYGHLATVEVRVGERVEMGRQLGTVGDTGSLTGASLYFEIRQGADALNPSTWLRRR